MIIGIAGTLGAGKGTVVKYLLETRGFRHYSARKFLLTEITRRDLPAAVRDNMSLVANDLRSKYGAGYIIEQLFEQAQKAGGDAVIESLHTQSEAEFLKSNKALVLGVDADIKTRYERILKRESETDHVTFEKFLEDNKREIASDDPKKHNIQKVIDMADVKLTNNGTPEELFLQVEETLKNYAH